MEIRKSTIQDLDEVMACIHYARQLMRENGNNVQWVNGYPSIEMMASHILKGVNYVVIVDGEIVGTFDFILEEDPNYKIIENGHWLNDEPYGVVHRLATNGKAKGIAQYCFEWCFLQIPNIRVDTHESNIAMQKVLEKLGYHKCGIIYVQDGTPRLAYQKIA